MSQPPVGSRNQGSGKQGHVSREIAAEAAVWVARLHGPDRDPKMELDFRAWLASSDAHREAFEKCTEVWEDIPLIQLGDAYRAASLSRSSHAAVGYRRATWHWAAIASLVAVAVVAVFMFQQSREQGSYNTSIGEQRLIVLDDGTRMLLNTETQVRVELGPKQRTVQVEAGEALFEVAKDANRPFVVRVAGSEVVALGTAFAVRFIDGSKDDDALSVTLIEGKVKVRPTAEQASGIAPPQTVTLQPGERLLLDHRLRTGTSGVVAGLDRPNVDQVTAWKRREAVFHESTLADAVEEMNRYSRTPVVLSKAVQSENLHISGVFRTGDNAGFARAVATLHGLGVKEGGGRLELANVR